LFQIAVSFLTFIFTR